MTRQFEDVIRAHMARRVSQIHTALPGRVTSYDSDTFIASVQPLIKRRYKNLDGDIVVEDLAIVQQVPVIFPGSGGRRIKWDILPGDTVLLLFTSASIDKWLNGGNAVDPESTRQHDLTDAIAIPGLIDPTNAGDKSPIIEFTETEIRAGGSQALALQSVLAMLWAHVNASIIGPLANPTAIGSGTVILKGS